MFPDRASRKYTLLFFAFAFFVCGLVLAFGCYGANSPHLPPCPEAGASYTDPAGCFDQIRRDILDGGRDAR